MRISERMGLVYTALFLTVSVAVITQNSDSLMAAFRGESSVKAVDDIFTVRPGRDQRLFVLSNDVHAQNVPPAAVKIASNPSCGKIEKAGGSFVYSQSITCSGQQVFQYCIDTGEACEPARVVLMLENTRPAIDSIAAGPETELNSFERQVGINGQDLEITNVRLGRAAPEEGITRPVAGSKLARVAAGEPPEFRPAPITGTADVRAEFEIDPKESRPRARPEGAGIAVAANAQTANDASPDASGDPSQSLPRLPGSARLPKAPGPGLAIRIASIEDVVSLPAVNPAYDNSPFGTPCAASISGALRPGGMVAITADIPCRPNSRVEIYHGKLKFTELTGHSGHLSVIVPALERKARFLLRTPGEAPLQLEIDVPDIARIDRVAIQWEGSAEFDLQAFEFGAAPGSAGHVWSGQPRSIDQADRNGGGYLTELGTADVSNPVRARIYSYPVPRQTEDGVIRLVVTAAPDAETCGRAATILSHRSSDGRLLVSNGFRIRLPDCGNTAETIVLKNALEDMIIARK